MIEELVNDWGVLRESVERVNELSAIHIATFLVREYFGMNAQIFVSFEPALTWKQHVTAMTMLKVMCSNCQNLTLSLSNILDAL